MKNTTVYLWYYFLEQVHSKIDGKFRDFLYIPFSIDFSIIKSLNIIVHLLELMNLKWHNILKDHSLCYSSLLMLYILWVWTNVWWHVSFLWYHTEIFFTLKILCSYPIHQSSFPQPNTGNNWTFYCLHSFALCRISNSWNHKVYSFVHTGLFHLVVFIQAFSISFHGLIAHLLLVLNSILSSGYTTVCLSIHLVLPSFGNYEAAINICM